MSKEITFELKTDFSGEESEGVLLDGPVELTCNCTHNQACKECREYKGIDSSVWAEIEKHFN